MIVFVKHYNIRMYIYISLRKIPKTKTKTKCNICETTSTKHLYLWETFPQYIKIVENANDFLEHIQNKRIMLRFFAKSLGFFICKYIQLI